MQSSRAPLPDLVVEILELPSEATRGDPPADWCSLGSSRTGSDGRFSVALDDVAPDAAARRRVVAAVYCDNSDGNGASPRPLAVTRAHLEPVTSEDLLVHIPDAVLEEHDIEPKPPVLTAPKSQGQLAAARLRLAESTQRSLREATSPELKRRLKLRRRGSALGRRLLAKKGRPDPRRAYVAPGEPAAEHLAQARAEGIRRLEAANPPGRTLRLDEASVRRLFPQDVPMEPVPVPVDLSDQLDVLFPTSAGASRLVDLLMACRAERIAGALDEPDGHGGAGTHPHGTPAPG